VVGNELVYEADPKHAQILCDELGLGLSSKGTNCPSQKHDFEEYHEKLNKDEATKFRALAARASYLSLDRPDIMFAFKEVCREMSAPTNSS
jgi:hypothetical protein